MSKAISEIRTNRKQELVNVLGGKCQICGFNSFLTALEFHHEDPSQKKFDVSPANNNNKNIIDTMEEVKKCFLLCANCHRGVHSGELEPPKEHIFNEELANEIIERVTSYHQPHSQKYCANCGKPISRTATLCVACKNTQCRNIEHPTRDDLKSMIRVMPFTEISKKYGVHRESVRKWCRKYNLPDTKIQINNYSDEEWLLI